MSDISNTTTRPNNVKSIHLKPTQGDSLVFRPEVEGNRAEQDTAGEDVDLYVRRHSAQVVMYGSEVRIALRNFPRRTHLAVVAESNVRFEIKNVPTPEVYLFTEI